MLRFREVSLNSGVEAACRRCVGAGAFEATDPSPAAPEDVPDSGSAHAGDAGVFLTDTGTLDLDTLLDHVSRVSAATGVSRIGVRASGSQLADVASAHRLLASGVRVVEVVFLGSVPERHDALTGVPGSFARAAAAVRACFDAAADLGVKVAVRGRVGLCAHNLQEAPATVMHLAELGVTSVVLDCDPGLDVRRSSEWVAAACDTGTVNRIWVAVKGMSEASLGDKALHAHDVIESDGGPA